jgi:hypothetical protein
MTDDSPYVTDADMEFNDDMLPYLTYHKKSDIRPGHIGAEFEIQTNSNLKPNVTLKIHQAGRPNEPVEIAKIILANSTLTKLSIFVKYTPVSEFEPLNITGDVYEHAIVKGDQIDLTFINQTYISALMVVVEDGGVYDEFYSFNLDIIGCRPCASSKYIIL